MSERGADDAESLYLKSFPSGDGSVPMKPSYGQKRPASVLDELDQAFEVDILIIVVCQVATVGTVDIAPAVLFMGTPW